MFTARYSSARRVVIIALWLVFQTGGSMAATQVYRCIDEVGQVVFSQFLCPRGGGDALRVRVPKIGWQKSTPRPSEPQKGATKGVPSASPGKGRKPAGSRKDGCWKAQRQLQQIARRLRKGYRRDVGERLRRQREDQEAYVSRFCPARSSSSR